MMIPTMRTALAAAASLTLYSSLGCHALTDVKTTDVVDRETVTGPIGAASRYAGALRLVSIAMIPTVLATGAMSDELVFTSTFAAGDWALQTRTVPELGLTSGQHFTAYNALHQARINLLHAAVALKTDAPSPRSRIARMYALAGYVYTLLGENFCSGVPLSDNGDTQIAFGSSLTQTQLLEQAVTLFDSALVYATDSVRFQYLARVGKARTLVQLGRYAEAATTAQPVPTTFRYDVEYSASTTGQTNTLFNASGLMSNYTVAEKRGVTGLNFISAADPRVRTTRTTTVPVDGVTTIYSFAGFTSLSSPIALATGAEARLIESEAALKNGDVTTYLAKLNDSRAATASLGLAPLTDPGSADARLDLVFRERAFWMYATAHRLADLRRLVRQYGRAQASVFPSQGNYKDGTPFGADVNLPIPDTERYNPNFQGCLDRKA